MATTRKRKFELDKFFTDGIDELVSSLRSFKFSAPITHVYNPLEYARDAHLQYMCTFAKPSTEVLLLGMNPGPWGMAQTGVPFGEVNYVRDWLGISAEIGHPTCMHPKRPIQGFSCTRSEVSGSRLWGWAKDSFGCPTRFFERFFVVNYCPLVFMESSGKNFTPDKLPAIMRKRLFGVCNDSLRRLVKHLKPRMVIGVGVFAEKRAQDALSGLDVSIGRILHPSPASPMANRNWAGAISQQLQAYGIIIS